MWSLGTYKYICEESLRYLFSEKRVDFDRNSWYSVLVWMRAREKKKKAGKKMCLKVPHSILPCKCMPLFLSEVVESDTKLT